MMTIRPKLFKARYLRSILLVLLTFTFGSSWGQTTTVKGIVKDASGIPLPGVTVQVKGTSTSTATSATGAFSINAAKGAVLRFSFIGYQAIEKTVGDEASLTIILSETSKTMNEVVVVGYGTTTKGQLTSAVSTVKAENFNQGVVTSPADLLEGKVSGLNITNDGNPNGTATVTLRGPSTARAEGASPFYVIDGVPDADIKLIAPADIASIDVLKDASAAAIYGSRATNGVIIVTTKRAKAGQLRMTYDAYAGVEKIANQFQVASASQLKAFLAANGQSLTPANDNGTTNWEQQIERNSGFSQNHNLSFGGGTDKTVFGGSINYLEDQGIVKTSGMNRFNGRLNLSQKALNDKLKLDFSLSNSITNQDLIVNDIPQSSANGANPNVFRAAVQYLPTRAVYNADGTFYDDPTLQLGYNPLGLLESNTYKQKVNLLLANAKAELQLPFGFVYNLSLAYQDRNTTNNIYLNSASELAIGQNGVATRSQVEDTKKLFENYLSYEHTWSKHNLKALVGYSYDQSETGNGFGVSNEGFVSDATSYYNLGLGQTNLPNYQTYYDQTQRIISFYSRLNYSYSGKYILQASIRRDGSNAFGKNHQWGYFPAVSGAWRVSEEPFMKSQNLFDDLKLRIGYGQTGNAIGFSPYTPLVLYGTTGTFYYNTPGASSPWISAIGPTQNPNPDLQWETTATLNAGIDFSLLKGRLSGSIDVYDKKTSKMIFDINVPTTTNFIDHKVENIGNMDNKGIEIGLSGTPIKSKDFSWESYGNIAFNKNKITSLGNNISQLFVGDPEGPGQSGTTVSIIQSGYPLGEFYTLKYIGMTNGVSTYLGANGQPTTTPSRTDQTYAGNAQPTYTFGWGNTLVYKGFSFNFFFRGQGGNKIMDASLADFNTPYSASSHNVPVITLSEPVTDVNANKYSTRYLESGSFIRLSNATLSYRFKVPGNYIHAVRLYVTGTNLFIITKYKGVDPELNLTLNGQASGQFIGVDMNNYYPKTRTFLGGIQVDL
jgi:iron complex outermembrane receptor protein